MSPNRDAQLRKLHALLAEANPDLTAEFKTALTAQSTARALRFIAGVKAYQNHPACRDVPDAPVIMQFGSTVLRDYNPQHPTAPIVFVIPSLINGYDILDLDLAPSFLRTLASRGYRPLVVDWGTPGADEKNFALGDYVQRLIALLPAKCHVLGYCMGGLLGLALATLKPERVQSLALVATPWDFHKPDPMIGASFATIAEQMEPTLDALGTMPVDAIQMMFAMLQPLQVMNKFTDFAALDPTGMEARKFVLLEDWLNDGVPLTANVARECLKDWYGKNVTAHFNWRIDGHIIDPRSISMPSYVIAAGRDKIVPPESALPLAKLLPHSTLHEPMTGHIGMMASRNASHQVWAPLIHWLDQHN